MDPRPPSRRTYLPRAREETYELAHGERKFTITARANGSYTVVDEKGEPVLAKGPSKPAGSPGSRSQQLLESAKRLAEMRVKAQVLGG